MRSCLLSVCLYLTTYVREAEPGGYIQWHELDWGSRRVVCADSSLSHENTDALLEYVSKWEAGTGPKTYVVVSVFLRHNIRYAAAPHGKQKTRKGLCH